MFNIHEENRETEGGIGEALFLILPEIENFANIFSVHFVERALVNHLLHL